MRIVWELGPGQLSSRTLAARCGGISPTVLHRRLSELRDVHLVDLEERRGYALTDTGRGLLELLVRMEAWAASVG